MIEQVFFDVQFLHDGSWWSKQTFPLSKHAQALKLFKKAKKLGNGNKARMLITTVVRASTVVIG